MGLKVHMIDEKFGMLTVLEELKEKDKNGKIWYKCRCECGNIINVKGINLRTGHTKSCGCIKHSKLTEDKIIGKKFGEFTVIKFVEKRNRVPMYECECSCGKIMVVNIYNLISGRSTNCGHARIERNKKCKNNLIGKKFGKLTVIEKISDRTSDNKIQYFCKCDCGNTCNVRGSSLTSDHTKSCGCSLSSGNMEFENIIKELNLNYKREYTVKLKNQIIPYFRFDMYLTDLNIAIEYDGIGHYKSIELFGADKGYELTKIRDSIKNKYCEDNNIKLLRIPYWEFKNMRKIIIDFITNND